MMSTNGKAPRQFSNDSEATLTGEERSIKLFEKPLPVPDAAKQPVDLLLGSSSTKTWREQEEKEEEEEEEEVHHWSPLAKILAGWGKALNQHEVHRCQPDLITDQMLIYSFAHDKTASVVKVNV